MPEDCPLISVIIVNWNGRAFLDACLSSLEQQTFKEFEVILADNGSTDDSVAIVRSHYPWVRLLEIGSNQGYTGGNNLAARVARGKYLFFLNNDTKLDPYCLERLAVAGEEQEKSILACCQLSYDGSAYLSQGMKVDFLGYPAGPATPETPNLFYSDGASLFLPRQLFMELDGFDDQYFMFCDDLDLCWRARLAGYTIRSAPTAVVYHYSGGTSAGGAVIHQRYVTNRMRRYMGERNALRTIIKNYSTICLLLVLPLYLALNVLEVVFFTLIGKWHIAYACYLKAWLWNIKHLGNTLEKRRLVQSGRYVNDLTMLQSMSVSIGKLKALRIAGIPKFRTVH